MAVIFKKCSGVVVPMVSPFRYDFSIDINAAKKIANNITRAGAMPFLLGSTGEGPSMSPGQKELLVKTVVEEVNGRSQVYAGISANSFISAIEEANCFAQAGVDLLVVTLPFYYPVNDLQMLQYFEKIADASPLPIILYNMPGMVKRSIPIELADRLSRHPNIIGLKDSERNENRLTESVQLWKNRNDFAFLVGWAAMSVFGLQLGADGIVPSTGNICPEWYVELYKATQGGENEKAMYYQELTNKVSGFYQQGRDLSQAIPALKIMMEIEGFCTSTVLPPMFPMDNDERKEYIEKISIELKQLIDSEKY